MFDSYAACEEFFAKARYKERGRPVNSWCRMYREGNDYVLHVYSAPAIRITPDNTLVFELSVSQVCRFGMSLAYLGRVIPFVTRRIGNNRYSVRVIADYNAPQNIDPPEYFEGIAFNLDTLDCVNRGNDQTKEINAEKRREWLRTVKQYRKGLQLRAKIGALDTIINTVRAEAAIARGWDWRYPDWAEPSHIYSLVDAMQADDYSQEILTSLIQSVPSLTGSYAVQDINSQSVIKTYNYLIKTHSVQLRRAFGVFDVDNEPNNHAGKSSSRNG